MPDISPADQRSAKVRAFNRFYTRRIGVLEERLLHTPFSLAESRLLWELAHAPGTTATELAWALEFDAGYLSRLLGGLKQRKLVTASRSRSDGRQTLLSLSAAGKRAFAPLDRRSHEQTARLLEPLSEQQQLLLLDAMHHIETLLGAPRQASPFVLRAHRSGDIGWVVSRHGALYTGEFGWDMQFEALVAHIAARFIEHFDPATEACWIAERDGHRLGSVFLVQARDEHSQAIEPGTAQLRMLLVEPSARGLGLGVALVAECERFARRTGYRRIRLWTNSLLLAARGIYERAGYKLLSQEPHKSFGKDMVGEIWELELR